MDRDWVAPARICNETARTFRYRLTVPEVRSPGRCRAPAIPAQFRYTLVNFVSRIPNRDCHRRHSGGDRDLGVAGSCCRLETRGHLRWVVQTAPNRSVDDHPGRLLRQELGYLPLPGEAASALFQVVNQRYLKSSIIMTTNRPVTSWGEVLGDTTVAAALLDRLLHSGSSHPREDRSACP